MSEASQTYLIALGSNRRHARFGAPRDIVRAAIGLLEELGSVTARSQVVASPPLGPSRRRFANAAVVLESRLSPRALLARLKAIETDFGRRRARRWGARVLDLDIVLWSGGLFADRALSIPHREFRERGFVLGPASDIAGDWRDPVGGRTLRQLSRRLSAPKPLDRGRRAF
ncbi:MAG: 2-amino-4-hydroxy-6-hydroxymethyldihydropteridine diphosphokinase [Sphingomonadales bacterium]|nr:2-amino-4-hydroxy-6-hydroxymethyldihydropteridine diphosphokinase [Sphingomonadales bacterium]